MEFAVALLFNSLGIAVAVGAGTLLRLRRGFRRALVAAIAGAVLAAFLFGRDGPGLAALSAWPRPVALAAPFLPSLILASGIGGLAWFNRWLGSAATVALFGLAVQVLFGFVPVYGWGLIALPPLLAGLLVVAVRPSRRIAQAALVAGWLLVILTPATLALLNVTDQLEWEIARAATGYFRNASPQQNAAVVNVARRREIVGTALYLLVTLGTLTFVSIPVIEHLAGAIPDSRSSVDASPHEPGSPEKLVRRTRRCDRNGGDTR